MLNIHGKIRTRRERRMAASLTLALGALLLGGVGITNAIRSAYADEVGGTRSEMGAETTFTVEIPDSLSLSLNDNLELNFSGGEYNELKTDDIVVTYSSSNQWGYTLSMVSDGEDGDLKYQNSNATSFDASIPSVSTTTPASSMKANSWGYSLDGKEGSFLPIPVGDTAAIASSDASQPSTTKAVTIGAIVDGNLPAGMYKDTLIFTLIGTPQPPNEFTLKFDSNGGGFTVPNQVYLGSTADGEESHEFTIDAFDVPLRPGYVFLGWSETPDAEEGIYNNTGSGDNGKITLTSDEATKTLYAVWAEVTDSYMQNFDAAICGKMAPDTTTYLVDSRDTSNGTYRIAKLQDDKCWMVQNLRLVGPKSLGSSDSDISSGTYSLAGAQTTPNFPSSGSDTTSSVYYPGKTTLSGAGKATNIDTNSLAATDDIGAYYTFNTATATTTNVTTGSDAGNSICPKNWKLPKGGTSEKTADGNEFTEMLEHYLGALSGTTWGENRVLLSRAPLYFVPAGYVVTTTAPTLGDNGNVWSSRVGNSTNAYILYFNSSNVNPRSSGGNLGKRNGYSVRCVFDPITLSDSGISNGEYDVSKVLYMQKKQDGVSDADWTSEICESSTVGEVGYWKDARDSKVYKIKKLADGRCYMVQNLDYRPTGGNLEPTMTDVTATVEAPTEGASDNLGSTYTGSKYIYAGSSENGTWYNWHAAVAYKNSVTVNEFIQPDPDTSICPKGWTLPKGDTSDGSWHFLYNNVEKGYGGNAANFVAAFEPVFPGFHTNTTGTDNVGSDGYWWSRTTRSSSSTGSAYYLYVNTSSSVNPQNYYGKSVGFSVRCVAR